MLSHLKITMTDDDDIAELHILCVTELMHLLWRYYTTLAECTFSNRTMRKPTCHLLHAKASHLRYSLRNRQWGGSVYVLQMFFFVFFCFFLLFRPSKNMRQPFAGMAEQIFMKLLHSGENVVCIAVPKCGLGPPINFWGAKNCTLHTWWWRLASDWELLCWLAITQN